MGNGGSIVIRLTGTAAKAYAQKMKRIDAVLERREETRCEGCGGDAVDNDYDPNCEECVGGNDFAPDDIDDEYNYPSEPVHSAD